MYLLILEEVNLLLLGPNGAGKTSLFYIVMGLIKSDGGIININNENISELPMYRRSKLGVRLLATGIFNF